MSETFDGLNFIIQYRRKADANRWHNMAAFDVTGPAEKYFGEQNTDDKWPWEYRLLDLENNRITTQSPTTGGEHG